MTQSSNASNLLVGEAYRYQFGASQGGCWLGRTSSQPEFVLVTAPSHFGGQYDWHLIENAQGALNLRLSNAGPWTHGGAISQVGGQSAGQIEWCDDSSNAIHFAVEDAPTADRVRLKAVHNRDGSTMLQQSYLYQTPDPLIPQGFSGACLTQSPDSKADWRAICVDPAPTQQVTWRDTYQPTLRHSAGFFVSRMLQEAQPGAQHPPPAATATQILNQLDYGVNTYDPEGEGATAEATVNAGLLTSHAGFYNDNEPDDELKQPPDWDKVKEGLDDAGFPDA